MDAFDARFDLGAVGQPDRIVAPGQAGHERLITLQARAVQALQLDDWLGVVVDAQVELRVVFVGVDAQCRGLLATLVATRRFAGGQRGQQALGQRQPFGIEVSLNSLRSPAGRRACCRRR